MLCLILTCEGPLCDDDDDNEIKNDESGCGLGNDGGSGENIKTTDDGGNGWKSWRQKLRL